MNCFSKTPPHDIDLECSLIASCLLGDAEDVLSHIKPEAFYRSAHQKIMSAIFDVSGNNIECDLITISNRLSESKQLEECGGATYLAQLIECPISTNIEDHCLRVNQYFSLRCIIESSSKIMGMAFDLSEDPQEIIDTFQKDINNIAVQENKTCARVSDIVAGVCDTIDYRIENKQKITGVSTGFNGLDWYTGGLQPTDLIILAARPGVGKTSFALNLLESASKKAVWTDFYSLEMGKEQLVLRLISMAGDIKYRHLQSGMLTEDELKRYPDAAATVNGYWASIDDDGDVTINEIRRRARKNKKKHGTGLIIIDYLQLMTKDDRKSTNDAVGDISRGAKLMAKELNVPVVLLSQLNRKVEERSSKIPILSDLRDSGNIEQDADIILFPYRESMYVDQFLADGQTETAEFLRLKNVAKCFISKHRNGPVGTTLMSWDGRYSKFGNPT